MFGLKPEDLQQEVEIWEVNRESFSVFNSLSTQWRTGMNGATGLDYAVLPTVMDLLGVGTDPRRQIFMDVRVMEQAALEAMAEARD